MTTQTTIADRASVEILAAHLLITSSRQNLPPIERFEINPDSGIAAVRLHSGAAVDAWREALIVDAIPSDYGSRASLVGHHDHPYGREFGCHVWTWHGWCIRLNAREPHAEPLPDVTVAALEAVTQ